MQSGFHGVVVRERHQRLQTQPLRNLLPLQLVRFSRGKWRRPIYLFEIHRSPGVQMHAPKFPFDEKRRDRRLADIPRQAPKKLPRMHGVTMQRHATAIFMGKLPGLAVLLNGRYILQGSLPNIVSLKLNKRHYYSMTPRSTFVMLLTF